MDQEAVIEAVSRAVRAAPHDAALRLHLAELLAHAGQRTEAVAELGILLGAEPGNEAARSLMVSLLNPRAHDNPVPAAASDRREPDSPDSDRFDWEAAESDVGEIAQPMSVTGPSTRSVAEESAGIERPTITLADVSGMSQVKERLSASFLAPLHNPDLRRLYGKGLRGGLLLYGPPGCGKTFLAKALAGELGAGFITAGLPDILDMWLGSSERNLHELFNSARRNAPCILFLDEIDALGQRRSQTRLSAMRGTVNQLLTEMDGVGHDNNGVYVLAATNQPWDVDPALRRPGRLDRTLLVLPPDAGARSEMFRRQLADRPMSAIDTSELADRSQGFSGADIALVCEAAAERALLDSVRTGTVRLIDMDDLRASMAEVVPSTGSWMETAKTIVQYGEDDGTFAELRTYLKRSRRW